MRNIYIKSAILSMLTLYITVFLYSIQLNTSFIILFVLISIALNIYYTYSRMQKLKHQFNLFGDHVTPEYDEVQISKPHTNTSKFQEPDVEVSYHPLLNERDIEVFEDVIKNLRMDIQVIVNCMNESSTVQQIMDDTGGEKALHIMYTTLHSEPERLTDVGDFAYANVPYLSRLIRLHVETEFQVFKNERTHKLLKESEEAIRTLAEEIVNNYLQYKNKDLDKLEAHIKQTAQLVDLKRKRKEY